MEAPEEKVVEGLRRRRDKRNIFKKEYVDSSMHDKFDKFQLEHEKNRQANGEIKSRKK